MNRLTAFALLHLIWAVAAAESRPDLRRIFTTPAERVEIERARRLRPGDQPVAPLRDVRDPLPRPPSVTVNGLVRRGDGRRVVWINGSQVTDDGAGPDGVRVLLDEAEADAVTVLLPGRSVPVKLKPGETFTGQDDRGQPIPSAAAAPGGVPGEANGDVVH